MLAHPRHRGEDGLDPISLDRVSSALRDKELPHNTRLVTNATTATRTHLTQRLSAGFNACNASACRHCTAPSTFLRRHHDEVAHPITMNITTIITTIVTRRAITTTRRVTIATRASAAGAT